MYGGGTKRFAARCRRCEGWSRTSRPTTRGASQAILAGSYLVNGLGDGRAVFLAADAVGDGGRLARAPRSPRSARMAPPAGRHPCLPGPLIRKPGFTPVGSSSSTGGGTRFALVVKKRMCIARRSPSGSLPRRRASGSGWPTTSAMTANGLPSSARGASWMRKKRACATHSRCIRRCIGRRPWQSRGCSPASYAFPMPSPVSSTRPQSAPGPPRSSLLGAASALRPLKTWRSSIGARSHCRCSTRRARG